MMKQEKWLEILDPMIPWEDCYAAIEQEVKAFLDKQAASTRFSTEQVATALWWSDPQCERTAVPKRLYRGLAKCAQHGLAPYCRPGAPKKMFGRMATPLIWFKAKENADDFIHTSLNSA
jgi:hypothetical protein